jgi:integrase
MRAYLPKHKERGVVHVGKTWVLGFTDHDGIHRHISSGLRDKRQALALGRRIEQLMACRIGGEPPDAAMQRWIDALPRRLCERLAAFGVLDRGRAAGNRPLAEHLEDFVASLEARGVKQAQAVKARVAYILRACGAGRLGQLSPSAVERVIGEIRDVGATARSRKKGGASLQTANHYLRAVKQFTRWLRRDGRTGEDVLAHLRGYAVALDRRHDRRALRDEELARLIHAAETGRMVLGVNGPARAMLYLTAVGTGLRAGELRSLTPESFDLDADPPVVVVEAGYSKRRRRDVQPIRHDLAERLRAYLADKGQGDPAFVVPRCTAKMMRHDLAAARAAWLDEAGSDGDHKERERSDVLAYRDASGRVADFHALRHTYVSRLVRSGANIRVVQELARHSTPALTLGRYAHVQLLDQRTALDALPSIETPTDERDAKKALGA